MSEVAVLVGAMLSPLLALAPLLWLTHLEETLPHDVHTARRKPSPPPILAVEVQPTPAVLTPTDLSEGESALAV